MFSCGVTEFLRIVEKEQQNTEFKNKRGHKACGQELGQTYTLKLNRNMSLHCPGLPWEKTKSTSREGSSS